MGRIALALTLFVLVVARVDGGESCPARVDTIGSSSIHWIKGPDEDRPSLDQWCRGVGPPIYVPQPVVTFDAPPDLEELVVLTWNAHLAEGRLRDLVDGT
jgi:hypothetical protein